MLEKGHTNHKYLDTLIGHLNHLVIVLPQVLHSLSFLRQLQFISENIRYIALSNMDSKGLYLLLTFLEEARDAVNMNPLT